MKKLNSIKVSIFVVTVLCGLLYSAVAQTTAATTKQWRKIHLKNIRPDTLAYWLDSAHQVKPVEYRRTLPTSFYHYVNQQPEAVKPAVAFPNLSIPNKNQFDGVLAADDSENDLWVLSAQNVFNMIEILSSQLDKPASRFEFEVQEVAITTADLNGLLQMPALDPSSFKPFFGEIDTLKPTFQKEFHQLIAKGKARFITSPRVTTQNDFPGEIRTGNTTPIAAPGIPTFDVNRLMLSFTPYHIENGSDSTTVAIAALIDKIRTTQLPPTVNTQPVVDVLGSSPAGPRTWFTTTVSLKENETVALSGFSSTSLGMMNDKNQNIVLFVTMREVHDELQGQSVVSHKQNVG